MQKVKVYHGKELDKSGSSFKLLVNSWQVASHSRLKSKLKQPRDTHKERNYWGLQPG